MSDPKKLNLLLLYGGRSGEHEVSLNSASYIVRVMDESKYLLQGVWIDHRGDWFYRSEGELRSDAAGGPLAPGKTACSLIRQGGETRLLLEKGEKLPVDFAFPAIHGSFGEDGRLQGLFESFSLPYAGSGVQGSALAMDKILTRKLLATENIPQVEYLSLDNREYESDGEAQLNQIEETLHYPIFIKPANLGSSVGVTRALNRGSLKSGIEEALHYDIRIILEEGKSVRELEVGIIGNREDVLLSEVGEVVVHSDFYSYRAKYEDDSAYTLQIPADIPDSIRTAVQKTARLAYQSLNCEGFARADMFYIAEEQRIYFNEINTIPGFTRISMFPRLWKHSGIDGPELIDRIIELGLDRHHRQSRLNYRYVPSG